MQETITAFRDFQRQSLQQLLPGAFDQDDYDEWKKAEALFLDLQVTKHTKFYWKCLNTLQELKFWRKYFIDIASSTDEDKLQLLEAMTGVSRNNEDIPKQLGLGLSPGSSSSVGNNSGGQSSPGLWGPGFQQWEHHQTHNIGAHRQMRNNGAHRQIHNNGVYSLVFNSGEHHQMRKNGAHRQLDSSGAHRQLHNNGAHHQLHHSGAHHRMLNNGAHHRMLSIGTHRRMLSNVAHHRMLINGEHH